MKKPRSLSSEGEPGQPLPDPEPVPAADPPITSAPVPPSAPGIPRPFAPSAKMRIDPTAAQNLTISPDGLTATSTGTSAWALGTNKGTAGGKVHVEMTWIATFSASNVLSMGVGNSNAMNSTPGGPGGNSISMTNGGVAYFNGVVVPGGVIMTALQLGQTMVLEIDFNAQSFWVRNISAGPAQWNLNAAANPATGVGGIRSPSPIPDAGYFMLGQQLVGIQASYNFSGPFLLQPSAGFFSWDTFPLAIGQWLPPPQMGMGGNTPFPIPVVPAAPAPPSVAGIPQPVFIPPGSATVPASLFPMFTTNPPSPPIVFANIFMNGPGNPPQTVPPSFPIPPLPTSFMAEANEVAHEQRYASDDDRSVAPPRHRTGRHHPAKH